MNQPDRYTRIPDDYRREVGSAVLNFILVWEDTRAKAARFMPPPTAGPSLVRYHNALALSSKTMLHEVNRTLALIGGIDVTVENPDHPTMQATLVEWKGVDPQEPSEHLWDGMVVTPAGQLHSPISMSAAKLLNDLNAKGPDG